MSDTQFRSQLQKDPESALKGYDLTQEERAAVASGSAAKLQAMGVDARITKSAFDPLPGHGPDRG
jgi:hypothetical protein